ncbi:MAG TPA: hypothetical protein DCL35_03360 [Candidatus Omnitrophica bacterium]|nr:hypothetical protein [Candidatus Omnitrophota bacterium]
MKKIVLLAVLFFAAGLFAFRMYNERRFNLEKRTVFLMDTLVSVYAVGPKQKVSAPLELALKRMREIEAKFSAFDPKSPVYAFNHFGTPITDKEILSVARAALKVSELSDGAFDITTFPLSELWGFASKSPRVPTDDEIRDVLKSVGYKHLVLTEGRLEKDAPGVVIGFGGIAKGYAVGEAVRVLRENGVASALVEAGGHVYALGKRGKNYWKVGIQDPRGEGILGYVEIEDMAVLGSGDYERFFIDKGKRYSHIFDPRTGHPAQGASAVTIIYNDPMLADALAKVPFVLGLEKSRDIIGSIPGMEAIMVAAEGEVTYSPGLKDRLKLLPDTEQR